MEGAMSTIGVLKPDHRVLYDRKRLGVTPLLAALLRLFHASRERHRHSKELAMDPNQELILATFVAFDVRRLVDGSRSEHRRRY
jgi:hypothetical protein